MYEGYPARLAGVDHRLRVQHLPMARRSPQLASGRWSGWDHHTRGHQREPDLPRTCGAISRALREHTVLHEMLCDGKPLVPRPGRYQLHEPKGGGDLLPPEVRAIHRGEGTHSWTGYERSTVVENHYPSEFTAVH